MQIPIPIIKQFAVAVGILFVSCSTHPHDNQMSTMKASLQSVDADLKSFASVKRTEPLEKALRTVESINDTDDRGAVEPAIRKSKVMADFHILRQLEQFIDPTFDPNLPNAGPTINVVPPAETQLPPGVDPQAIKDPRLRKRYESAIAENQKKQEYYNQQFKFRRFENELHTRILNYLDQAYAGQKGAIDEVNQLATEAGISKKFQQKIKSHLR